MNMYPKRLAVWCGMILLCFLSSPSVDAFTSVIAGVSTNYSRENLHCPLYAKRDDGWFHDEDEEVPSGEADMSRRGILSSLLGGAVSMVAGDAMLNTALSVAQKGSGAMAALYGRVLSFGKTYQGAGAIASEDLLAWVGAQKSVAATPEIQAWLAAQRKLQTLRKSGTAIGATASAATARTGRRAASQVAAGGTFEEGIMAAAAGTVARKVIESGVGADEVSQETPLADDVNAKVGGNERLVEKNAAVGDNHDIPSGASKNEGSDGNEDMRI